MYDEYNKSERHADAGPASGSVTFTCYGTREGGGRKDEFEEARQDFKDVEMLLHQKILFKIRALPVAPYYSTHFWSRANFQNR